MTSTGRQKRILSVLGLFLAAAVLCGAAFLVLRHIFPETVITNVAGFTVSEGTVTGDNVLTTTGSDCYILIPEFGHPLISAEITIDEIVEKQDFDRGTIQIFYDNGSGFRREDSIRLRLREGMNRAFTASFIPAGMVRFDLFDTAGNVIRIRTLTLNSWKLPNLLPVIFAACLLLFAALFFGVRMDEGLFVRYILFAFILIFGGALFCLADGSTPVAGLYLLFGFFSLFLFALAAEGGHGRLFRTVLLLFAFSLFFFWMISVPYTGAPDEGMRYSIVTYLVRNKRLPRGDDPALINKIWGFSYAFYPILSYMIGAVFHLAASLFTDDTITLLHAARMTSVLSGVLAVYWIDKLAEELYGDKAARYSLPVFFACFPMLAFISSYINVDSFAMMTACMISYFWVRGLKTGWNRASCIGLGIAVGLCALSYYNIYAFILCSILLFFSSAAVMKIPGRKILRLTLLISAIALAIAGWWFVRNAILYHGDFLGRSTLTACQELHASEGMKPSQMHTPAGDGLSLTEMLFSMGWLKSSLLGLLGCFGNQSLYLRKSEYLLFGLLIVCSLIGIIPAVIRSLSTSGSPFPDRRLRRLFYAAMALAFAISFALAVIYSYTSDYQPQGRYLMPCLPPLALFAASGAYGFDGLFAGRESAENTKKAAAGSQFLTAAMLLVSFVILLDVIYPYYW